MGSIATGNTTLRSSRAGCQNEQQLTKRLELWPGSQVQDLLAAKGPGCRAGAKPRTLGWQSENCHVEMRLKIKDGGDDSGKVAGRSFDFAQDDSGRDLSAAVEMTARD